MKGPEKKLKRREHSWAGRKETCPKKSGVSLPTIAGFEQDEGELGGRDATRRKLFAAFKRAGLMFLNAAELGVTLRTKRR
jgi:hypothetical protein